LVTRTIFADSDDLQQTAAIGVDYRHPMPDFVAIRWVATKTGFVYTKFRLAVFA
jgi:hypothetical protein